MVLEERRNEKQAPEGNKFVPLYSQDRVLLAETAHESLSACPTYQMADELDSVREMSVPNTLNSTVAVLMELIARQTYKPLSATVTFSFYRESHINQCALIYKRPKGNTPNYLNEPLILNSSMHMRNTRYCNLNLFCPRYSYATEGGRSFTVRSIGIGTLYQDL